MPHPFELRKEITLDATPEEVWDAIATGPGIDSWFMGRNEVTPGEGGRNGMDLGGHVQESTVTAWQPPLRFAHRSAEADDGSFMAMEFLVEGRDQGSTVLRLVQSGVLGDDWETEYEAMAVGWDMYLHTLAAYLTHFPGRTAAPVGAFRPGAAAPERAWAVLKEALGLPDRLTEGDAVRLAVPGGAPVEGVVDYLAAPAFLGVRTADGLYRFIHSGPDRGNVIVLGHHVFDSRRGRRADRAVLEGLARRTGLLGPVRGGCLRTTCCRCAGPGGPWADRVIRGKGRAPSRTRRTPVPRSGSPAPGRPRTMYGRPRDASVGHPCRPNQLVGVRWCARGPRALARHPARRGASLLTPSGLPEC